MANPTFSSPINLNLPQVPVTSSDELQNTFQGIFNALRTLQQAIGDYTGAASGAVTYTLSLDLKPSQSIQIQNLNFIVLTAYEAISAGQIIGFIVDVGVLKARKANAAAGSVVRAWGWSPNAVTAGSKGIFRLLDGYQGSYAGLTVGQMYWLSESSPGGIQNAAPVGAGKLSQEIGVALSATELLFHLGAAIQL